MLNDAKEAEAARMLHHFNVLSFDGLWRAVRVAQATASALTRQYARPACMKRGLLVYSRVQQRTKTILDMISFARADPTKPTALGRNYNGMRAQLARAW
jgi:hypothetical protein